jgi:hypothetical protein
VDLCNDRISPNKGGAILVSQVFRLKTPLKAVGSGEEGKRQIVTIAPESIVVLCGTSAIKGFVEIEYSEQRYNVFEEDLRERADQLGRPK